MTENIILNSQELFEKIVERGRAEGVASAEAYKDLIEVILTEMLGNGELDPDQDTKTIQEALESRFGEYDTRLRG